MADFPFPPASGSAGSPGAEEDHPPAELPTRPIDPPGPDRHSSRASHAAGMRIGDYKILQHLGSGGFGDVYLAEQEKPVSRRVALKLIKLGMDTRQVLARFEAERQALALMDHPGIAKILGAGTTPEGRPYFAMEYTRGVPIDRYCDENRLRVGERIALFTEVCRAVQHAHHKGIVHRDIKPGNVLVTLRDGAPAPVVIDFGISKALDRPLVDGSQVTQIGQFLGTPEYISPEQAQVSGLDIDTRSDVYSLGVLLYQLLTGTTPYDPAEIRSAGLEGIRKFLCDREPPKPSTRISRLGGDELISAATARCSEPRTLIRALNGDLDCIVMKCLEKDRTRRYESPSALADDLLRHVGNEPVLAGPPTVSYRFGKFVRRNRVAVITSVLVIAALVGGSVLATAGLLRAREDRDLARREEKRSSAIRDFLVNRMLQAASPNRGGPDTTVREVMEIAGSEVDEAFRDDPELRRAIHGTLAQTYNILGLYTQSEAHADQALAAVEEGVFGAADRIQAQVWKANALRQRGELEEAESWARAAVEESAERLLPEDEPSQRSSLALALILWRRGKIDEALSLLEPVVALRRELYGDGSLETITARNVLGMVLRGQGRNEEAIALYRDILVAADGSIGPRDPQTLMVRNNLAVALGQVGEREEALELFESVWRIRREVLGPAHDHTLSTLANLARSHYVRGDFARAEELTRESLEAHLLTLDPDHPQVLKTRSELADALVQLGRIEEGRGILHEVLTVQRRALGDHSDTIFTLRKLGELHLAAEEFPAAAETYRECLAMAIRVSGADSASARTAESGRAESLVRGGMDGELAVFRREQLARVETIISGGDASAGAWHSLAELRLDSELEEQRDAAAALEAAERAVARSERGSASYFLTLARARLENGLVPEGIDALRAGDGALQRADASLVAHWVAGLEKIAADAALPAEVHDEAAALLASHRAPPASDGRP